MIWDWCSLYQEIILKKNKTNNAEEVDKDNGEEEGEKDWSEVPGHRFHNIPQGFLPQDYLDEKNGIEKWMETEPTNTENHEEDVVKEFHLLENLSERFVEGAHVPNDANKVDTLEDNKSNSKKRKTDFRPKRDNEPSETWESEDLQGQTRR